MLHATIWDGVVMRDLGEGIPGQSLAAGLNDHGTVVAMQPSVRPPSINAARSSAGVCMTMLFGHSC